MMKLFDFLSWVHWVQANCYRWEAFGNIRCIAEINIGYYWILEILCTTAYQGYRLYHIEVRDPRTKAEFRNLGPDEDQEKFRKYRTDFKPNVNYSTFFTLRLLRWLLFSHLEFYPFADFYLVTLSSNSNKIIWSQQFTLFDYLQAAELQTLNSEC